MNQLRLDLDIHAKLHFFRTYMIEVREAAQVESVGPPKKNAKKIGTQKGGVYIQDTIDISTLTNNSFDTNNCASAHGRRRFCLCVGLSSTEIRKNNKDKRDGHREEMTKWHTASVSRRGPKPKMPKMMSQQLACMCTRMHCLNCVDGKGCFVCELACENAKSSGRDDCPYFDKN